MKTKKQQIEKIKELQSGEFPKIEYPLFWTKQGDYYVAGKFKFTIDEYQKLKIKYPCFCEIIYVEPIQQ